MPSWLNSSESCESVDKNKLIARKSMGSARDCLILIGVRCFCCWSVNAMSCSTVCWFCCEDLWMDKKLLSSSRCCRWVSLSSRFCFSFSSSDLLIVKKAYILIGFYSNVILFLCINALSFLLGYAWPFVLLLLLCPNIISNVYCIV